MSQPVLVVRVSRLLLLLLCAVGLLFVLAGLDLAHFGWVLGTDFGADKPFLRVIFILFAMGIGGIIAVVQAWFLLVPPVMLRVDDQSVTFGTGLWYKPLAIPRKALASVEVFTQESEVEVMGKRKIVVGGVALTFKAAPGIPESVGTSAGIAYADHTLLLYKKYMDCSPDHVVQVLGEQR